MEGLVETPPFLQGLGLPRGRLGFKPEIPALPDKGNAMTYKLPGLACKSPMQNLYFHVSSNVLNLNTNSLSCGRDMIAGQKICLRILVY